MIFYIQIYLVVLTVLLSIKDSTSYLLKTKDKNLLVTSRVNRWHLQGAAIFVISLLPLMYIGNIIEVSIAALLIRLSLYDLVFNKAANLDFSFFGTTSKSDIAFSKIFVAQCKTLKSV